MFWRSEPLRVLLAVAFTPPVVAAAMVGLGLLTVSRPDQVLTWEGFVGMYPHLFRRALPGCYLAVVTYGLPVFLVLRVARAVGFVPLVVAGAACGWFAFAGSFPGRPPFPGAMFGAFGGGVFWWIWRPSRPPSS